MLNFEKFILNRLNKIQKRNNFDPKIGLKQVKNFPDRIKDFIIFKEYLSLIQKLNLCVEVPFDPVGLNSKLKIKLSQPVYVYFAWIQEHGLWKIGSSINVDKRIKQLQTGCPSTIRDMYRVQSSRSMENIIKKLTLKHKIVFHSSEWRKLDKLHIKLIVDVISETEVNTLKLASIIKSF